MLEVGRLASFEEDRAHFGAWAIVSAPLVLGFDLRDDAVMDRVWPVISNQEAIAVNQQWEGSPGRLVQSEDPSQKPDALGFLDYKGALAAGFDLKLDNHTTLPAAEKWCGGDVECDGFTYRWNKTTGVPGPTDPIKAYFKSAVLLNADADWRSQVKAKKAPPGADWKAIFSKPQPNGAVAVYFLNAGPLTEQPHTFTLDLSTVGLSGTVKVRDIWGHSDMASVTGTFVTDPVAPHDSRMYLLNGC